MIIASIDRHPIIRKGLGLFLQEQFESAVLLESESYESFIKSFTNQVPDLIILGFTEESNICESEIVRIAKEKMPDTPVVVYDGKPRYEMAVYSLVAGASAYLVKNSCLNELVKCLKSVTQGKRYMSDDVMDILLKQCMKAAIEKERIALLSEEELIIARLICQGLPSDEIANIRSRKISVINKQKLSIYKKLEMTNVVELRNLILS
ncbi:response regulator transcription factor [Dyadobacter frigoris]|uniref:Response regulator transcription factor n=1 Tax=Dyadobacter frigoris TaxID=2576211 RepID=A0A4U6D2D1_9BACT|nr:response regulator transcription factor [Dyadobacter frigoris]TKT90455.1 response regulator transcription factor [Dyadobacter frigoris]